MTSIASLVLGVAVCIWFLIRVLRDPFKAFLIMLPFMVWTRSVRLPVVGERIVFFDVLLLIWWFGIATRKVLGNRDLRFPRALFWPAFAYYNFLVAAVTSLLGAPVLVDGLEEVSVYAFLGLWGLAIVGIATSEERIKAIARLLPWIVSGVVLISLWEVLVVSRGLLKLFPVRYVGSGRVTGPFRNPNQLGIFLFTASPFAWTSLLFSDTHWRLRWMYSFASVGATITLILTSSRSSMVVATIQLLMLAFAVLFMRTNKQRWRSIGGLLIICALCLGGVIFFRDVAADYWGTFMWRAWPVLRTLVTLPRFEEFAAVLPTAGQSRFAVRNWSLAWQAFLENPLWGAGIGNFRHSYQIIAEAYGAEIHSQYSGVLAETGAFGFLCFAVFLLIIAQRSLRLLLAKPALTWMTVALFLSLWGSFFGGVYIIILRRREFWLVLGLMLAYWDVLFRPAHGTHLKACVGSMDG